MDKKVGVSILFSFLVLVGLIGVSNAIINSSDSADMLRSANMTIYGDGFGIDNTTKGGVSEIVNVTILAGTETNISNITITWVGNYTFDGWISDGDVYEGACQSSNHCENDNQTVFANVTIMNGGIGNWNCTNLSTTQLNCHNNTYVASLSNSGSANSSIIIRFNVTASGSLEDRADFNISVENNLVGRQNSTVLTAFIDGVAPTMFELNVSDGNTTWGNGTFNGTIAEGYSTFLSSKSALTVTATFHELTPHSGDVMWLFYNGTEDVTDSMGDSDWANSARVTPTSITQGSLTNLVGSKYTHPIKYTWTIPASSVNNFGDDGANYSLAFMIMANDTFNNLITLNDTSAVNGALMPFSIGLNDTLSSMYNISFQDSNTNLVLGGNADGSNGFVAADNLTISFTITGTPKPTSPNSLNDSEIWLYYNTTGSMYNNGNGAILYSDKRINMTDVNTTIYGDDVSNPTNRISYETSINLLGNDTNTLEVYVVWGNKTGDSNEGNRNLPGNYTTTAGPYRIVVDGGSPSASLSTPSITGISTSDSIEYTCTGTDGASGISKYIWTLVSPGGENVYPEVITPDSTDSKTFSGADIASPGRYNVKCLVYDGVGNPSGTAITDDSNDFTVSVSSSSSGSGGSGGSGGTAAVSFDVDFTDSPKATLKAAQGRIKSFSFDGATKHTITFNEVTATTATLIIASDPVTVQLNVGQSKEVDVNNDGISDMKVTLNSIANNVADITVEKVEAGAEAVEREEREARGLPPTEGGDVTPVAKGGLSGLWWALLVIAAIVVIGYFVSKRK